MRFLNRGSSLVAHEKAVLEALADRLSAPGDRLLRAQIDQIRHVQRISGELEVNFYANRKGGGWDPNALFQRRTEFVLGRLRLRYDDVEHRSAVHAVNGHVFALVIRPILIPRIQTPLIIEHVEAAGSEVYDTGRPLRGAAANIPKSYLNYVAESGPQAVNGWSILNREDTYSVSPSVADMVVLAAGTDGRLLTGADGESFWVYDPAAGDPIGLRSRTFSSALDEAPGNADV